MTLLKNKFQVTLILFIACCLNFAFADQVEGDSLPQKDRSNKIIFEPSIDGLSFETAVQLGLPLGPLIRAKSRTEKKHSEKPENTMVENNETLN